MVKKSKKYKKYVPPPIPDVSLEEAEELERKLRSQINTWGAYPRDKIAKQSVLPDGRPGINWQKRITETLLPQKPRKNNRL